MDLRPRTPSPPARPAHNAAPGAVRKRPAARKGVLLNPLPPAATTLNSSPAANSKLPAGKAAAAVTAVQTQRVECWVYREGGRGGAAQESSSESGAIARDDIARWLGEPPRKSLVDNKAPVAGLRLVCRRQRVSMERPFDEPTLRAIHAALGLSEGHNYLTTLKAGACGKYIAAAGNPIFIYHRSNNNGTISAVTNYDSASNMTRGYILMGPRISIKKVCDEIMSQFLYFSHPLVIPTVLIELTAADLMGELYHIHRLLAKAEDKTRFGDWELGDATADFADGEELEEEEEEEEEKDEDDEKNDGADESTSYQGGAR